MHLNNDFVYEHLRTYQQALFGVSIVIILLTFSQGGYRFIRQLDEELFATKNSLSALNLEVLTDNPYIQALIKKGSKI